MHTALYMYNFSIAFCSQIHQPSILCSCGRRWRSLQACAQLLQKHSYARWTLQTAESYLMMLTHYSLGLVGLRVFETFCACPSCPSLLPFQEEPGPDLRGQTCKRVEEVSPFQIIDAASWKKDRPITGGRKDLRQPQNCNDLKIRRLPSVCMINSLLLKRHWRSQLL